MEVIQKPHLHASWIDPDAQEIVRQLQKGGFTAYLVGGCVRDLLAGIHPKDYDIATDAHPNQVKKKVWGSYVIGRRFRLVLVKRGDQQFEVATFRRSSRPDDFEEKEGEDIPSGDNFFGTPEEDALRRDFTMNSLFYDPIKNELIDFANGREDIENHIVRMIGDPATRIIEDPIRSLRAIRLAHKLNFKLSPELRYAIQENAAEVEKSALPRRREEYLKTLRLPNPALAWLELYDLGILKHILPSMTEVLSDVQKQQVFIEYLLQFSSLCTNPQDPIQVWCPMVLAWTRAMKDDPQMESKRETWMRNELNIFKSEQVEILQAMDMAYNMPIIASFLKRGHRRKAAFFSQISLPIALRIARLEKILSPEDQRFWETNYLQFLSGNLPKSMPSKLIKSSPGSPSDSNKLNNKPSVH